MGQFLYNGIDYFEVDFMIMQFFEQYSSVIQALLAGLFTFLFTALGASIVLFFKRVNKTVLDSFMAASAGVMLSSAFFSLIQPAISISNSLNMKSYIVISIGFFSGAILILVFDRLYELFNKRNNNSKKRCNMLFFSITIHNIPEGLILGVSFGSIFYNISGATLTASLLLTLGIALQNFPEGCALSLPLRREGNSRFKSFMLGSLSAIVEPISAVIGAIIVMRIKLLLPFLLSFAAGAMIYVVISELIPEYSQNKRKALMNICTFLGFILMMILDIAFG